MPPPDETHPNVFDAYSPREIAKLVENVGVAKARLPMVDTLALSVLAGAFIAFGAMFATLVTTGNDLGFGLNRLIGGIAFSLGLILVIVGGAELFTGNNLIVMAWADRKITALQLGRNWALVFAGNFIGAVGAAVLVHWSGVLQLDGGAVAANAAKIATAKTSLPFAEAFFRGVLCNALVCLAVWLCFAAHTVSGKILAIIFPISAFVALGFEHSIANMYFIPLGWLLDADGVTVASFLGNLIPVTLGNIVGGSVFVALVYWQIYLRRSAGDA
ncbi:MAG: formate/nitrite transporter family protein [Alphaproteobacteria bacterium]|nr:formate/nitrite transporter family protein [Alphaproteobacteria bacterium]